MSYDKAEALRKYYWKMHHVRLRNILPQKIEQAKKNFLNRYQVSEYPKKAIKDILDSLTIPTELRLAYYAYAEQLYASQVKLKYMVDLIREHQILRSRYQARGLDPSVLDRIDERLIIHKS